MSLPLAFQAKTSRLFKITKVPCFAGFLSTGRGWGASRGLEPLAPIRAFWGQVMITGRARQENQTAQKVEIR